MMPVTEHHVSTSSPFTCTRGVGDCDCDCAGPIRAAPKSAADRKSLNMNVSLKKKIAMSGYQPARRLSNEGCVSADNADVTQLLFAACGRVLWRRWSGRTGPQMDTLVGSKGVAKLFVDLFSQNSTY